MDGWRNERSVRADGMKKVGRDNEIDTPRDGANPRSSESGGGRNRLSPTKGIERIPK